MVQLNCNPCIDRTSYKLKAILHGSTDDQFWQKLNASAHQSALDMRVNLELQLYEPGDYNEDRMARDIKSMLDSDNIPDALIVTIPSVIVADAVKYVSERGVPVFGMNSGYDLVSGRGGLVEEGNVLFFTAMNERLGGERSAEYFLREFGFVEGDDNNITNISRPFAATTGVQDKRYYGDGLYITPLGERSNSAFQQRFDGYHDTMVGEFNTTMTNANITVEWMELDTSVDEVELVEVLTSKLSNCNYKSILLGSHRFVSLVLDAVEANGCRSGKTPTLLGTFDTSELIFNRIQEKRWDFAIEQFNHMQGWTPVHLAALFVSTGLVISPPLDGVYVSGPVLFTQDDAITDTFRKCTDDAFPVCPNTLSPNGQASSCPCTDRKKIRIGGVVHGITTDSFWDAVFDASKQAANDMGIQLVFDRFEPQESSEILYKRMSAKILSLCQEGVDGIFVSISNEIVVQAVQFCLDLNIPVVSINAGYEDSKKMGLIHHIGMVERSAGFGAGNKMASMETFNKAYCINHAPGLEGLDNRCQGFGEAMTNLGIQYVAEIAVPEDNVVGFISAVEESVQEEGDWDGIGFLLGASNYPSAMPGITKLRERHNKFVIGSFDINDLHYQAIDNGNILFGIDQQPYLQGYLPIPILTHAATSKQFLLNHAIETGPAFLLGSPGQAEKICEAESYPVCPQHPIEDYSGINNEVKIIGYCLFAIQALAAISAVAWMINNRKSFVVRASQPEFLSLVAFGCLMVASAIIPLSIEGGYSFQRDAITLDETEVPNDEIKGVNIACMAVPWLVCVGFVLMYSALFAKLNRIKEIMDASQSFRRVTVPRSRVLGTVGVLLSLQVVILLSWQLYDPLVWTREVTVRDSETEYPIQSIGKCTCENVGAFAAACACFIGACLAYALKLAYQTWNLPVEFSESRYIAISIMYLLQLLLLGSPLLFIAQGQNNTIFYIVACFVLFLSSFGTTLLIFVPKLIAHKKNQEGRRMERTTLFRVWRLNTF